MKFSELEVNREYENQREVDLIFSAVRKLAPDATDFSSGIIGNRIVSVYISVPVKGNKAIIERLCSMGWKCLRKQKNRCGSWSDTLYWGYTMMQVMELSL